MKSFARLRKRELVVCLAAAFAIGLPIEVASAANPLPPAARFQPGRILDNVGARLGQRPSSPRGIAFITNCDDSGPGSLRDAVSVAADGDHIDLRALACSTITLGSAIAVGAIDLYIDGPGRDRFTIDGGGTTRLFETADQRLTLTGLRLANGYAMGDGGCIVSAGYVQLTDSLITGCYAHAGSLQARGGAIFAYGVGLLRSSVVANVVESDSNYAKGGGFYTFDIAALYSTIDSNEARSMFSQGLGGGAFVGGSGPVIGSAVTRNRAYNAAGLSFVGGPAYTANINESTVSDNVAQGLIGGVYTSASMFVLNSTIAFNCAGQTGPGDISGVGFEGYQISPYFESTIVSNNFRCTQGSAYDIGLYGPGLRVIGSHNLVVSSAALLPTDTIRADPMLGPLADNGGHNETHALLPGSPAIDAGSSFLALPWDGRWHWFPRINGSAPDIGAFESDPPGTVLQASSCADSGVGSLRDLATVLISGDTIDLTHLTCSRITLTSGAILLGQDQNNLKIVGPGSQLLTIDGNAQDRILVHDGAGRLELDGLAFENGDYSGSSYPRGGGCILSFGLVTGSDTKFESCTAHAASTACYGGAIRARGAALYNTRIADSRCSSDSGPAGGGGIAVDYELTLGNATLANNVADTAGTTATLGGGFLAEGDAEIEFSTISGNSAGIAAAGYAPKLVVSESTISGNTADVRIGGLAAAMGTLYNSTVAFNATTGTSYDVASGLFVVARGDLESSILFGNTLDTDAYDVGTLGALFGADDLVGYSASVLPVGTIHDDPLLGPLQDNGGPTETHALGDGSPAIDAGNNDAGFDLDQRGAGFARVNGATADIGAFETQLDRIFASGFDP